MKKILCIATACLVIIALCVFLVFALYWNGDIGMSEDAMRQEVAENLREGWAVADSCGEDMAAFLEYREDRSDYTLRVYTTHSGTAGWFFRYAGSVMDAYGHVYKVTSREYGEYVLFSMNDIGVERIEIDRGNSADILEIQPGMPFAVIISQKDDVTIYDADGRIIEPVRDPM